MRLIPKLNLYKGEFVKNIEQNYTYFLDAWVDMEQSLIRRRVLSLLVVVGACIVHLHTQPFHHWQENAKYFQSVLLSRSPIIIIYQNQIIIPVQCYLLKVILVVSFETNLGKIQLKHVKFELYYQRMLKDSWMSYIFGFIFFVSIVKCNLLVIQKIIELFRWDI